ncbi:MAG: hypothetical protein ABIY37_00595 [Devosia sp.]
MVDPVRVLAYGSFFGSMMAWSLVAPDQMSAVAEEPVRAVAATVEGLFPDTVDPKMFRKYKITFDDSISTEVQRTQVVKKIGHGRTSQVTIVTTPSGTYSTDGLLSPHVQYPGIEKELKGWGNRFWFSSRSYGGGRWTSFSTGSFTYYSYRAAATRT